MKLKPHLVPPGGYVFRDAEGVSHQGQSWPHLVRVVAQHRAMRKLAPGDPAKEITEVVCSAHPELCHAGPGVIGEGDKDAYHSRVASWLAKMVGLFRAGRLRYCDAAAARERAEVCRGCRYQDGYQKGCVTCQQSNQAVQDQLLRGRPDAGRGLLGCAVLSEDTAVSVHLDEPRLNKAELPAHCWRKVK
jgi:hypothetical protein